MEINKAKVRIYGQEYTLSGTRDENTIAEIGAYVDGKMREVGKFFSMNAQGSLAILAAVNLAEELFDAREKLNQLEEARLQMEKDAQHYLKMWDEAKKSFMQYKEEALRAAEEKAELSETIKKLEEKCNEYENSYFDLQMENVQLKSRLEKQHQTR